jgi:hypothetical protein
VGGRRELVREEGRGRELVKEGGRRGAKRWETKGKEGRV